MLRGNILLITGGTGSFGNAVLQRFVNSDEFKEIRIFSRDEKKQDDLRKRINNSKVKFYIGDVRDLSSVETAVNGVDYIFHAAALKQVPSCEFFPIEAVKTNILGTDNVLTAAEKYNIKRVVVLSTDTQMTRFMMTLEDAVDLVLFAFENGRQGDIFVQKSPAATVKVLAEALIKLYKANNPVNVIGTRHGEKLYETLVNREDMVKAEDMGNYYRIPADNRDLNYAQYFSEGEPALINFEEYHSHNTDRLDIDGMIQLLCKLPIIRKEILGEINAIQYPD